jgi:hypothetical protein
MTDAIFDFPNISFVKYNKVCFRSAKETSLSIYNLLGERCSANEMIWPHYEILSGEMADRRFIVFHVTHLHRRCVRTQQNIWVSLNKKVSCMSRAGWYSGRFRAVKLCQSSSISGPSDTLKPIVEKISII